MESLAHLELLGGHRSSLWQFLGRKVDGLGGADVECLAHSLAISLEHLAAGRNTRVLEHVVRLFDLGLMLVHVLGDSHLELRHDHHLFVGCDLQFFLGNCHLLFYL